MGLLYDLNHTHMRLYNEKHAYLILNVFCTLDVLAGYNGTIFAYGQTASGKTHTMEVSSLCAILIFHMLPPPFYIPSSSSALYGNISILRSISYDVLYGHKIMSSE